MKGTRRGKGPPSTDLLVCFPSRAHLTLMPKPICSPARHSDSSKRHHNHDLKKISTRIGGVQAQSSPLLWAKSKNSEIISEPTSPKVTCAGILFTQLIVIFSESQFLCYKKIICCLL